MLKLQGKDLYLSALERKDCETIWRENEVDFDHPTETPGIGFSVERAGEWFEEIQRLQGNTHVRLGIFLNDGRVIGDVALQNIDRDNRSASLGMGIARLADRGKGYGQQAVKLMLRYGFDYLGLHRITANTLDCNTGGILSLEKCGLILEGRERKAVFLNGEWHDKLNYAVLQEEYRD